MTRIHHAPFSPKQWRRQSPRRRGSYGYSQTVVLTIFATLILNSVTLAQIAHRSPETITEFASDSPWVRHTIDDSLTGADGVRLADLNQDGRMDIVTGWEESGKTRIYLHPGFDVVTQPWPKATVGDSPSVEDAVWIDLDGDQRMEVLSSCEGNEQSLRWHIPQEHDSPLKAWRTEVIPTSRQKTRWMFAAPFATRQAVIGSKSPNGMVGILDARESTSPRDWTIRKLTNAQWIMSLIVVDVDRDNDEDIVYSDRKGAESGVYWLENPAENQHANDKSVHEWKRHLIGALGREVMFLKLSNPTPVDPTPQQRREIITVVKPYSVVLFQEPIDIRGPWLTSELVLSAKDRIGRAKGLAIGDIAGDGTHAIVFSCEGAEQGRSGVVYLTQRRSNPTRSPSAEPLSWIIQDISGPEGIKFDRIELIDLDGDRDLDVLTCEERHEGRGLGVIWYANPLRSSE